MHRVVITGMGLRSPIGNALQSFCEALQTGKHGISTIKEWDWLDALNTRVGGVCHLDECEITSIKRKFRRSMGRVGLLAALAALDAVADAGLDSDFVASPACGVSFGSTEGSVEAQETFMNRLFESRSLKGFQSSTYLQFMSHTCAANLGILLGTRGPLIASCTACVAGSQGVGLGYEAIRSGRATAMVTGGAEELHIVSAGVFDIMRATSTRYNDCPDQTPKPFDVERDGLVVAEGAGCLILEEFEHARKRSAQIYAEIIGYGSNCNGTHLTNSDPRGVTEAIRAALKDARLTPADIGHINAHATGTETGDHAEAVGTNAVFGNETPVSGLKGYFGHTLGASGALESIATILMMREGFMAATKNLTTPDPAMPPLQHIIGDSRSEHFDIGMNNNFAFGGVNTSLIFKRDAGVSK